MATCLRKLLTIVTIFHQLLHVSGSVEDESVQCTGLIAAFMRQSLFWDEDVVCQRKATFTTSELRGEDTTITIYVADDDGCGETEMGAVSDCSAPTQHTEWMTERSPATGDEHGREKHSKKGDLWDRAPHLHANWKAITESAALAAAERHLADACHLVVHADHRYASLASHLLCALPAVRGTHDASCSAHAVFAADLQAANVSGDARSGLLVTEASRADVDAFLDTTAALWLVIPLDSPAEWYEATGRRRPPRPGPLRAAVAHAPPFVFQSQGKWTGVEVLLLQTMAQALRVPLEFVDVSDRSGSSGDAVVEAVSSGEAQVGAAGVYQTPERLRAAAFTSPHSIDCAVFLSLATAALPRYRAILGPFDWSVWLALTVVYLVAILPLAFSSSHSLWHLLEEPRELENMFWYVFGTFTNAFTFTGRRCWSSSTKTATRMLIGWYWVFSIIITACYTGSIIAFVTLPVYPSLLDTCQQAADWGFTVGTLGSGGWERWFQNSSDAAMNRVLARAELLPDVHAALRNVTSSWRRSYAFLGPRALLDFIIRTNYSVSKRSLLHVGADCVVPFSVSLALSPSSAEAAALGQLVLRAQQSGLVTRAARDVEWQHVRSSSGRLLAAVTGAILKSRRDEEHKLSLVDVQGTFLLLGAGFALGMFALVMEGVHACCRRLLAARRPRPRRPRCPTVTVSSPQRARSLSAADAPLYVASSRLTPELMRTGLSLRVAKRCLSASPDLCRASYTTSRQGPAEHSLRTTP